jgi:hypothetical protein
VALDEDNDRVRRFLKSKKDSHKPISFPVLLGNEEVFTRFEGYGIPYTLVLDRSLTIRHKANGRIALGNLVRIIDEIGGQQVRVIPREDDSRIARTNE